MGTSLYAGLRNRAVELAIVAGAALGTVGCASLTTEKTIDKVANAKAMTTCVFDETRVFARAQFKKAQELAERGLSNKGADMAEIMGFVDTSMTKCLSKASGVPAEKIPFGDAKAMDVFLEKYVDEAELDRIMAEELPAVFMEIMTEALREAEKAQSKPKRLQPI